MAKHRHPTDTQYILEILPAIRRFSFGLTGSEEDADDLVQSTLEKILRSGIPPDANPHKWAYRVCKNIWIDNYRKNRHFNFEDEADLDNELISTDGETQAMANITLKRVIGSLDHLTQEQRITFCLVSIIGYSYKDVASILDVAIGTVMSRVARARQKLMELHMEGGPQPSIKAGLQVKNHELH